MVESGGGIVFWKFVGEGRSRIFRRKYLVVSVGGRKKVYIDLF